MKKVIVLFAAMATFTAHAQTYFKGQVAPSKYTLAYNDSIRKLAQSFGDKDFEDAKRGLVVPVSQISYADYQKFYNDSTINPSLHRKFLLNKFAGLFEVIKGGVYQVRLGFGNIMFVKTKTGYVVIDTSSSNETAKVSYDLIKKYLGDFPVRAIIITHSHADHYGGVRGILDNVPNKGDSIPIIAPTGFYESAVSENVIAGVPMLRRSQYQFGGVLRRAQEKYTSLFYNTDVKKVGNDEFVSKTTSLEPATYELEKPEDTLVIDGYHFEFVQTPNTEAPSDQMIYSTEYNVLFPADNTILAFHNLLTPRGAKVRDGLAWAKYIDLALVKWGDKVQYLVGSHGWPEWGNENIKFFLRKQRDIFRYVHDQTLRLANEGLTPNEISNTLKLPEELSNYSPIREYYGRVDFNAKSQYQLYFGFFDGNPVNLSPLSPEDEAKGYVDAIGGADKVIALAQKAYDNGKFQWAATLLNNVIFSTPKNVKARKLLTDTYTQLGYQSESTTWRNFYLSAAYELQNGVDKLGNNLTFNAPYGKISLSKFFDVVATRINGYKLADKNIILEVNATDTGEKLQLVLEDGVLTNRTVASSDSPQLTITGPKSDIISLFTLKKGIDELTDLQFSGDKSAVQAILADFETPNLDFNIVEP